MYLQDKSFNPGVVEAPGDPFTLPHLIAWMRTKPADEVYCFVDNGECLIAQYISHLGYGEPNVGPFMFVAKYEGKRVSKELPDHWNDIANGYGKPHTFGAALSRALALRGAQ
jgi:hypothetical protein